MEEIAKMYPKGNQKIPTRTVMVAFLEGEESILNMETHSMFLNCTPVMCEELESDVLAKIRSVV